MRDEPTSSIWDLARQLLEIEEANRSSDDPPSAVTVCEKLRAALTRFAGEDGFHALTRRAISLARLQYSILGQIKLDADGCLEELAALPDSTEDKSKALVAIIAHLLSLLGLFVGESMMRRLVSDVWAETKGD